MLITKPSGYEPGCYISVKLVNGDEIVGKLVKETEESFVISAPCAVVPTGQGIGLMQAIFTAEPKGDFSIKKCHVMLDGETVPEIVNHYIKTTTNIHIASAGSLV